MLLCLKSSSVKNMGGMKKSIIFVVERKKVCQKEEK